MSLADTKFNNKDNANSTVLSLVADEDTKITLSDRPVFGVALTFREDISSLAGLMVYPGQVIGWIDYSATSKLACLHQHQYFDAQHFIKVDRNEISFQQAVRIHEVNSDLNHSNKILTFSIVNSPHNNNVTSISEGRSNSNL